MTIIKSWSYTILICLIIAPFKTYSSAAGAGAGLFLYQHTSRGDVEFLFASDPHQTHSSRQGFEYPGGKVDATDNAMANTPMSFLRAAIREMLEELVFVPADLLQIAGIFKPKHPAYIPKKGINPAYEKEAIDCIEQEIKKTNGIFYLHKNQADPNKVAGGTNQMVVFFWNISKLLSSTKLAINNQTLPQYIVAKRDGLTKQGFNLAHDLHAEPDEFAWISGNEIIKALLSGSRTVRPTEYAKDGNPQAPQTINISPACNGMMRDRSTASEGANRQFNTACIFFNNTFYGYMPEPADQLTVIGSQNNFIQNSSSMTAIIDFIRNQSYVFQVTTQQHQTANQTASAAQATASSTIAPQQSMTTSSTSAAAASSSQFQTVPTTHKASSTISSQYQTASAAQATTSSAGTYNKVTKIIDIVHTIRPQFAASPARTQQQRNTATDFWSFIEKL